MIFRSKGLCDFLNPYPSADQLRMKSGKTDGLCGGKGIVNFAEAKAVRARARQNITARGFT